MLQLVKPDSKLKSTEVVLDNIGSPAFAMKGAGFGGESVRRHALTPKSGYLPRKFPKSHNILRRVDDGGQIPVCLKHAK
jgi:hypothetical protein